MSNQSSSVESAAATISVTENLSLEVDIIHPDTAICEGAEASFEASVNFPGMNPVFEWSINGQSIPDSNDSHFTSSELNNLDQVTCTFLSSEMCVIENPIVSESIIVETKDCSVGTTSIYKNDSIVVYPNPVKNHLYISINSPTQGGMIKIYNSQGSELASQKVIKSDIPRVLNFKTQDYPTGVYSIQVIDELLSSTKIFIKK